MQNMLTREGKQKVLTRLDRLSETTPRRWGTMTVTEMFTHMNDAYRITLGMKPAKDRSNFFTRYITFPVAIYLLPAWPHGTPSAPEQAQGQGGSPSRDFYTEREFLKKMMDIFEEREEDKLQPHPMFGKLTKDQWADLYRRHFDHHLRQFGV